MKFSKRIWALVAMKAMMRATPMNAMKSIEFLFCVKAMKAMKAMKRIGLMLHGTYVCKRVAAVQLTHLKLA